MIHPAFLNQWHCDTALYVRHFLTEVIKRTQPLSLSFSWSNASLYILSPLTILARVLHGNSVWEQNMKMNPLSQIGYLQIHESLRRHLILLHLIICRQWHQRSKSCIRVHGHHFLLNSSAPAAACLLGLLKTAE